MRKQTKWLVSVAGAATLSILATAAVPAGAQQSLAEYVAQSCKTALETYCSQVTPGENRVVA